VIDLSYLNTSAESHNKKLSKLSAIASDVFLKIVAAEKLPFDNVVRLNTDTNSLLFKLESNKASLLLKIPSDGFVLPEVFFLRSLTKAKVLSPKVVSYSVAGPYPFILMTFIEGGQDFDDSSSSVSYESAVEYGRSLQRVHHIKTLGYGIPLDAEGLIWESSTWLGALKTFLEKVVSSTTFKALYSSSEIEEILRYTTENPRLEIKNPFLLHGDIPNGIMQYKPKIKFLAFIDPATIISGDPIYDIASVYCVNERGSYGTDFMRGFGSVFEKYIDSSDDVKYRWNCLRLFHLFWKSAFFVEQGWSGVFLVEETKKHLKRIIKLYVS